MSDHKDKIKNLNEELEQYKKKYHKAKESKKQFETNYNNLSVNYETMKAKSNVQEMDNY